MGTFWEESSLNGLVANKVGFRVCEHELVNPRKDIPVFVLKGLVMYNSLHLCALTFEHLSTLVSQ